MSSLQKFHRRTNGGAPAGSAFPNVALGSGDTTKGFCLGASGLANLYVAPKSTETKLDWGTQGTARGTTSLTDGLANTNTLVSFGTAAHPAAGYCKYLTTGGYNTWYLPAINELVTMYTNKLATPFSTSNAFTGYYHTSSTEISSTTVYCIQMTNGSSNMNFDKSTQQYFNIRAVRKSTV